MSKKAQKLEHMVNSAKITDALVERINRPRGDRYRQESQALDVWRAGGQRGPEPRRSMYTYDRRGKDAYGIFWQGRLLKLGKTAFTTQGNASAEVHRYIDRLTRAMDEEGHQVFSPEIKAYISEKGWRGVIEMKDALIRMGLLAIRPLDTIPNPDDEPRAAI